MSINQWEERGLFAACIPLTRCFDCIARREAVIRQVKTQCEDPSNKFGFPDASAPHGYQPAFNIYAWNEYGEGGILAPCKGQGSMMVDTIAKVLGR